MNPDTLSKTPSRVRPIIKCAAFPLTEAGPDELSGSWIETIRLVGSGITRPQPRERPRYLQRFVECQACLLREQTNIDVRDVPELWKLCETGDMASLSLIVEGAPLSHGGAEACGQIGRCALGSLRIIQHRSKYRSGFAARRGYRTKVSNRRHKFAGWRIRISNGFSVWQPNRHTRVRGTTYLSLNRCRPGTGELLE